MIPVESVSLQGPKRLAIVDDHGIMRGVFLTLIEDSPEFTTAWMAASIATARQSIHQDPPDLLLMDIGLPDGNGFDFVEEILQLLPHLPVLMISAHEEPSYPDRARNCGARGFIGKTTSLDLLVEALHSIVAAKEGSVEAKPMSE